MLQDLGPEDARERRQLIQGERRICHRKLFPAEKMYESGR